MLCSAQGRLRRKEMCIRCWKWCCTYLTPEALCPSDHFLLQLFSIFVIVVLTWLVAFSILGNYVSPHSQLFMLGSLFVLSYFGSYFITFLKIPPVVGMILVGMTLRNLEYFKLEGTYKTAAKVLRTSAMVTSLLKTGLVIDASALRSMGLLVFKLGFIPCLCEILTVTWVANLSLEFPWLWSLLLGSILGTVASGVLIPLILALEEQGYGVKKSITTIIIAAAGLDNILAISIFGIVLNIIFSEKSLFHLIFYGPVAIAIGLSFGLIWGFLCCYIPHKDTSWVVTGRTLMLGLGGLLAVHGGYKINYMGAGPVACVTMAFCASLGWRKQGYPVTHSPVEVVFRKISKVCVLVILSLAGASIHFQEISYDVVGFGAVTIFCGVAVRVAATFLSVYGKELNKKEMLFISITWIPKATFQGFTGPIVLDVAEDESSYIVIATKVLTLAILTILFTAPVGAICVFFTGPVLLAQLKDESSGSSELSPGENETQARIQFIRDSMREAKRRSEVSSLRSSLLPPSRSAHSAAVPPDQESAQQNERSEATPNRTDKK